MLRVVAVGVKPQAPPEARVPLVELLGRGAGIGEEPRVHVVVLRASSIGEPVERLLSQSTVAPDAAHSESCSRIAPRPTPSLAHARIRTPHRERRSLRLS